MFCRNINGFGNTKGPLPSTRWRILLGYLTEDKNKQTNQEKEKTMNENSALSVNLKMPEQRVFGLVMSFLEKRKEVFFTPD